MTTRALSFISVVLSVAQLIVMPAGAAADHKMVITGQVEVAELDMHGEAKALDLVSPELGRFRIAPDRNGEKLIDHVQEIVTVFGQVDMENGVRTVHVDTFKLITLHSLLHATEPLDY